MEWELLRKSIIVWRKFLLAAGIGVAIAGAVLGAVIFKSHGILAIIGGAVVGGIVCVFIGLNAAYMIEVIVNGLCRIFHRPK
jgi:hypothetical protein